MEKILVAIDGSETGNKALLKAKAMGTAFESEITILYVMEYASSLYSVYMSENKINTDPLNEAYKEHAMEVLNNALENFKDYNYKVCTLLKKGNPAFKILEVSEEGDFDLLIIGSRGLGPFSRAIMGSVSTKVLNNAKISVLVVK
jgi:nucleotide-binding universal stress UspA family protein